MWPGSEANVGYRLVLLAAPGQPNATIQALLERLGREFLQELCAERVRASAKLDSNFSLILPRDSA